MSYEQKATGKFRVESWSESHFLDIDDAGTTAGDNYYPNRGLSRAETAYSYTGDIEGTSTVTYLIAYKEGDAPVLGFERFEGSIGGQDGTCVFRHLGSHDAEAVRSRVEVVEGMGTGGLAGLRGETEIALAGPGDDGYDLTLHYDIS